MNLLEQLQLAGGSVAQVPQHSRPWVLPNLLKGHSVQAAKAKQRYKEALQEWTRTSKLENRLGYAATVCNATLRKYMEQGIVERRPVGGMTYNKKVGYEWRWICQNNFGTK